MSEARKVKLIQYGVSFAIGIVITVTFLVQKDVLSLQGKELLRILGDAFTIPGLLLVFSGLLVWLSNEGSLDGITYVVSYAFNRLIPNAAHKGETYGEFLERKHGKKPAGFAFLLVTGLVFLAVSVVFLVLYHQY